MGRKKATAFAFLDTTTFLQFQYFDQIDWPELLQYQEVCLAIAPITLTELEGFKYDRDSQRRQERSRKVSKDLARISESGQPGALVSIPNRPSVRLLLLTDSPDLARYPGLQPSVQDDHLLASILQFRANHGNVADDDVILVSDDTGLLNKARARGIRVLRLDETYRLPDEPTKVELELRRLKQDLAEMQRREPKLHLTFIRDDQPTDIFVSSVVVPGVLPEQVVVEWVESEAKRTEWSLPRSKRPNSKEGAPSGKGQGASTGVDDAIRDLISSEELSAVLGSLSAGISSTEIQRYRVEREQYLDEYRSYLVKRCRWHQEAAAYSRLDLGVLNVGSLPATGVVIQVEFPPLLGVRRWKHYPNKPDKPCPPDLPRAWNSLWSMSAVLPGLTIPSYLSTAMPGLRGADSDEYKPKITRTPVIDVVEWRREKAMHNLPLNLTPLMVTFPPEAGEHQYEIRWSLYADNLSTPVRGDLQVAVQMHLTDFDKATYPPETDDEP